VSTQFEDAYDAVVTWCKSQGIEVQQRSLSSEKAGEFNGVRVVMNGDYDTEQRLYYLTHAVGSIVLWSQDVSAVQRMFDELREAKKTKGADSQRLQQAIERYRAFEIESSELAVWLFEALGHSTVIVSYTNFMRADLEAMTEFHRTGRAPVWRDFFDAWNADVANGRRTVDFFTPKPILPFRPVEIQNQEILQR
jgi:hypothetical protein